MEPLTKLVPIAPAFTEVSTVSIAGNAPLADAAANTVIVRMQEGNSNAFAKGTGTYLGSEYVITANHVVDVGSMGTVLFSDGRQHQFRVEQRDTDWDLALLRIQEHPTLTGVAVGEVGPRVGERLYLMGYGSGSQLRTFSGPVTGYAGNPSRPERDYFGTGSPAVSGDSGGPILRLVNDSVELVGCLWGSDFQRETSGTRLRRVRIFCGPILPRLAQWRANRLARLGVRPTVPSCPDGQCPTPNPYQQNPACPDGTCPLVPQQPVPDPVPNTPSLNPPLNAPCTCEPPEPGPPGPKGEKGDPGKDAEVSTEQLAAIAAEITKQLRSDPSLKGPAGERGQAGKDGKNGTNGKDGRGVEKMAVDNAGNLIVTYTDGSSHRIANLYSFRPEPEEEDAGAVPAFYDITPLKGK